MPVLSPIMPAVMDPKSIYTEIENKTNASNAMILRWELKVMIREGRLS
jgi:hypothetical protein